MDLTKNKFNTPYWVNVKESDEFSYCLFHEVKLKKIKDFDDGDYQQAFHSNLGSITVLDRITGLSFGRDIETGFIDPEGKFWLASGGVNVIDSGCETIGEAIEWIKKRANNCIGE